MKRKISYLISVLAIAGMMLFPMAAVAHGDDNTGSNSGSGSTSSSGSDSTDDKSETTVIETENENMDDRITKFKEHFKVKLATGEAFRLKLKCKGAQKVVGTINNKFGNSITVRTNAYNQLQKNLDKLDAKLKAANVDTTTLESQITELKARITTYSADLEAYKQALSDLKVVNCQADPNDFQAALLAARSARETLIKDVQAIRTYLVETIKPTLKTIRKEFATKKSEDNSTTKTENSSTSAGGAQ